MINFSPGNSFEKTVSAVLARELCDLVSVHSAWLSQEVPGFAEALVWPELPLVESRGARGGSTGATILNG